jgi:hypothetical protein
VTVGTMHRSGLACGSAQRQSEIGQEVLSPQLYTLDPVCSFLPDQKGTRSETAFWNRDEAGKAYRSQYW